MNIFGIGVDIVENKRIGELLKKRFFINRTYSSKEINESKLKYNKINYYSKRFAAKEAFVKSLGTGFRNGVNLNDISVLNNKNGKPYFHLSNKVRNIIKRKTKVKKFKFHLSLSDESKYSISYVIFETK